MFSQILADQAHPPFSTAGHLATLPEKAALSLFLWTVLRGHVRRDGGGEIRLVRQSRIFIVRRRTCLALQEGWKDGQRNISSFGVTDVRRHFSQRNSLPPRCHRLRTGEQFAEGKLFWRGGSREKIPA